MINDKKDDNNIVNINVKTSQKDIQKDIELQNIINDKIITTLSKYEDKVINEDKSVTRNIICTQYFLNNNVWYADFFYTLNQFKDKKNKDYKEWSYSIEFSIYNKNVNNELKFVVYNNIFSEKWKIGKSMLFHKSKINLLCKFINCKYPNINSFKELDLEKVNILWIDWLKSKKLNVIANYTYIKDCSIKSKESINYAGRYLELIITSFLELTDEREEWEKEKWDIRNLTKKYNIKYSKSNAGNYIDFIKIKNETMRKDVMDYMKTKLINQANFSWGSACQYMSYVPVFLNFICDLEPSWNNLKNLERKHIEKYIEWLHIYAKNNLTQRGANPQKYIRQVLMIIDKFLEDIQMREYELSPNKNIKTLIFPGDKPTLTKTYSEVKYVPDSVLEQLFNNMDELPKKVTPIIYIMFKTGLRISDVLELKQNCLIRLNNGYFIETDIEKVNVRNHRIPIDDELASIIANCIKNSKEFSNEDNNPNKYIFVNYTRQQKRFSLY